VIAKAEAERRKLIDAEKAKLAAQETPVVDPVPAEAKRKNAASKAQPKGQPKAQPVAVAAAEPKDATSDAELTVALAAKDAAQTAPAPIKVKAPYNPEKLSGAAEAGKAPKKGQLPAGLLAYLAKKHAGSQVIAAAAQGQAQKPAEKARAGRKGAKR